MATTDLTTALGDAAGRVLRRVEPALVRIGRHGGRGTGVVIGDGLVLTNAHNLRDRTTEVRFADGRAEQAEVVGADLDADLAVLSVDTGEAPPIQWAGEQPDPGAIVFAASRTATGGSRVSFGMLSGVERGFSGPRGRTVAGAIEHTAALLPGSSGSPLLDAEGRVLGINTARLGDSFYLALPADDAFRRKVAALGRGEVPERPLLGVGVAPASVATQLRASVGLPPREGVLVRQVADGSPAQTSGVRPGDLITAAGGHDVTDIEALHGVLDRHQPGTTLSLHVVRGVEEIDVDVTLGTAG